MEERSTRGKSRMNGKNQSASIYTAVHNSRIICREVGARITYEDPTFSVAMGMAYVLDQLVSDRAARNVPHK
jgi:hypothetical protein